MTRASRGAHPTGPADRAWLAAVLAAAVAGVLGSCRAPAPTPPVAPSGMRVVHFTIDSRLVGQRLEQAGIEMPALPGGRPRPLLVLLHGRGGSPDGWLSDRLFGPLAALGRLAPDVVMADGGDHSYYHDRDDGRWGSYVVREVIPAAIRELHADPRRVAIGGGSMGGFGALDLARLNPHRFCAVGGHSAAIFASAGGTSKGAFDDPEDFARHDLLTWALTTRHPYPGMRVWMDVGRDDPFRDTDVRVARALLRHGADVTLHVFPGEHGGAYIADHLPRYVRFYAGTLARCRAAAR